MLHQSPQRTVVIKLTDLFTGSGVFSLGGGDLPLEEDLSLNRSLLCEVSLALDEDLDLERPRFKTSNSLFTILCSISRNSGDILQKVWNKKILMKEQTLHL